MRLSMIAALLLGVLTACTGSFEAPNPVFLITGYQDAAGAKVALIRDNPNPNASNTRLSFLPASVRALPVPAVSYDVVDRERSRRALVVLSRSPANNAAGAPSFLTTFSLTGIDPNTPAAFTQQGEPLELNTFQVVPGALRGQPLVFCARRLQVTQGGDYAAVLHVPSLCGLQVQPFIDILDLRSRRLLARLTGVGGVSSSGLYLSQSVTQDLLYYAVQVAGGLQLQRASLPRPGEAFGTNDTLESVAVANLPVPAGERDALDLQRAGADTEERLVFLFRNSLVNVTAFGVGATAQVSRFIETSRNNAFVIRDDGDAVRRTEATFVVSTPEAGVLTYLPPPSEAGAADRESSRVRAVAAVIVPTRNLIYFVSNQQIALFDIGAYTPGDPLPDPVLDSVVVPQLTAPSFVTWAQSVIRSTP